MKRVAVIVGLCVLLLSAAAWADNVVLTNLYGSVSITDAGIAYSGGQLRSYNGFTNGTRLGWITFSTGAFTVGAGCTAKYDLLCSGTFAGGAGSSFLVTGKGPWLKTLAITNSTTATLFSGSFVGPVEWQLLSIGPKGWVYNFELIGAIRGQFWDGRTVDGTTHQFISLTLNQWQVDHKGGIGLGSKSTLLVPEPSTLGLLGTGLIGIAGTLRRKLFGV
jgi:PEP-CTERM motif